MASLKLNLRDILAEMVTRNASDLYFTANAEVCFRVDGELIRKGGAKLKENDVESVAREILGEKKWSEFLKTNEQNLAIFDEELGRFRVNVMRQRGSVV
ncbi:MAG: type IV pili twitching motility protein PilT, partial [Candidatus Dadabacteria bacterium]